MCSPDERLAALTTERARRAPHDIWRRRLWWLIGEFRFQDEARPWLAIEAYTMALESKTPRPPGFDIACLAMRTQCLAQAGFRGLALKDHKHMQGLLVRAVPPRQRGAFLFDLAKQQWSDHGLVCMAHGNYLLAWRSYEQAGDSAGVAACAHEAGKILWYLPGDLRPNLDESHSRLRLARRLWTELDAVDKVTEVDDDLSLLFDLRREPRRRLGAATRSYLGAVKTNDPSSLSRSFPLTHRAEALNDLGRLEERDRALLQAIWTQESNTCPYTRESQSHEAARLRIRLLSPDPPVQTATIR